MKVETKCKFCAREIEMEVDQAGFANPAINAALWLKNCACNRCADYYRAKADTAKTVGRLCEVVLAARRKGDQEEAAAAREKLIAVTRKLCKLICDFKCAQAVWDISFVDMLMEQPHKFSRIINSYTQNLNRIIERSRAEQPEYA